MIYERLTNNMNACDCSKEDLDTLCTYIGVPYPLIFICTVCGKTYVCSCFDGYYAHPFEITRQSHDVRLKQTEIRDCICHLHNIPKTKLPLWIVESYAQLFMEQNHLRYIKANVSESDYEESRIRRIKILNDTRELFGYKRIGESWTSETTLFHLIQNIYPFDEVIHHYRAEWLGRLELDVYVVGENIGFEYQGIQHFIAQKHWGGTDSLLKLKIRDEEKKERCKSNGTQLIEILYTEEITEEFVRQKIGGTYDT